MTEVMSKKRSFEKIFKKKFKCRVCNNWYDQGLTIFISFIIISSSFSCIKQCDLIFGFHFDENFHIDKISKISFNKDSFWIHVFVIFFFCSCPIWFIPSVWCQNFWNDLDWDLSFENWQILFDQGSFYAYFSCVEIGYSFKRNKKFFMRISRSVNFQNFHSTQNYFEQLFIF